MSEPHISKPARSRDSIAPTKGGSLPTCVPVAPISFRLGTLLDFTNIADQWPLSLSAGKANTIFYLLLTFVCVLLPPPAFAQQQLGAIGIGGSGAKNIRLPLGDPSKPSAFLTIAEIGLERRQLGPLRLGVLQKPVFKNVTMEIAGEPQNSEWQRDLSKFLAEESIIASATFVGFCIQTADQHRTVNAGQAWYSAHNKSLVLKDLTLTMPEQRPRSFARAELQLVTTSPEYSLLRHGNQEEKVRLVAPNNE
jgi:hypothetical protein